MFVLGFPFLLRDHSPKKQTNDLEQKAFNKEDWNVLNCWRMLVAYIVSQYLLAETINY